MIRPEQGSFSPDHARYVLTLGFSPAQKARYLELAEKSNEGMLSEQEAGELREFVLVNEILMLLQSKARLSLKQHNPAA